MGLILLQCFCGTLLAVQAWRPNTRGITLGLGYEERAAVEHLLAAFGIPMGIGIAYVFGIYALCWASSSICKKIGVAWEFLAQSPLEVIGVEWLPNSVAILGFAYSVIAIVWELNQAFVGVYSGPPRGFVQIFQLACDFGGVMVAVLAAFRTVKK